MSELYSIKKETLTDIADALRRRHGETKNIVVEEEVNKKISKTGKSTGFDNILSEHYQNDIEVVTIEGASYIKVVISYQAYLAQNQLHIAAGKYTLDNFPTSVDEKVGFTTISYDRSEFVFADTDSITLKKTSIGNKGGYYAEIYGYDANDNPIYFIESIKKEVDNVYTSAEMAGAIDDLPQPLPKNAFNITGDCTYRFAQGGWDWFLETYGDLITTEDLGNINNMFLNCKATKIPFDLNLKTNTNGNSLTAIFDGCSNIKEIPKINNCKPSGFDRCFRYCNNIRYFPEDLETWFDWSIIDKPNASQYSSNMSSLFSGCASLRSYPIDIIKHGNPNCAYSYTYFSSGFASCNALDELAELPIPYTSAWTSNCFNSAFHHCNRLKTITFAMPDGQPYIMQWKSQTIDLTMNVGWGSVNNVLNYNSGITADKEVKDDESYARLKNDPDWFTMSEDYSRYNHDSAVETIQSLPDTSAYLASKGGTNTIKFRGTAGSKTDGGAINTMSEEVIALAASKGWTVTLS